MLGKFAKVIPSHRPIKHTPLSSASSSFVFSSFFFVKMHQHANRDVSTSSTSNLYRFSASHTPKNNFQKWFNSMMRVKPSPKTVLDMSSTCCQPLRSHVLCCWVCRWVMSTTSAVAPNACVSLASKTARGNHQGWMLALHGNALENQDAYALVLFFLM